MKVYNIHVQIRKQQTVKERREEKNTTNHTRNVRLDSNESESDKQKADMQ